MVQRLLRRQAPCIQPSLQPSRVICNHWKRQTFLIRPCSPIWLDGLPLPDPNSSFKTVQTSPSSRRLSWQLLLPGSRRQHSALPQKARVCLHCVISLFCLPVQTVSPLRSRTVSAFYFDIMKKERGREGREGGKGRKGKIDKWIDPLVSV